MKSEKIEKIVDLAATLSMRAEELDQVLIIYREAESKENSTSVHGSLDNDLTLEASLWLIESYKQWLTLGAIGLLPKE